MSEEFRVRRVVTGHDADGRSIVVTDDHAPVSSFPGGDVAVIWGRDDMPVFPDDGAEPAWAGSFPPPGGSRLTFMRILPGQVEEFDAFVSEFVPGDDTPGMHRTRSMDLDIVISGQLHLELDDGVTVVLDAGDSIVMNGTRHRWYNSGDVPAVMAGVSLPAENPLAPELPGHPGRA